MTTPKQSTCAMKAKANSAWVQEMFEPILSAVMSNQAHSQWKVPWMPDLFPLISGDGEA